MKIPLMRLQENKFGSKNSDAFPLPHPPLPPFPSHQLVNLGPVCCAQFECARTRANAWFYVRARVCLYLVNQKKVLFGIFSIIKTA